jgi:hypothetical protein
MAKKSRKRSTTRRKRKVRRTIRKRSVKKNSKKRLVRRTSKKSVRKTKRKLSRKRLSKYRGGANNTSTRVLINKFIKFTYIKDGKKEIKAGYITKIEPGEYINVATIESKIELDDDDDVDDILANDEDFHYSEFNSDPETRHNDNILTYMNTNISNIRMMDDEGIPVDAHVY